MNRKHNYIPDFSNVSVGQVWTGKGREANFIKALGQEPKEGNSRKAQLGEIGRYCTWQNNPNTKALTLTDIFTNPKERVYKPYTCKYAALDTIITYHIQNNGGVFNINTNAFWTKIGIVSSHFKKTPASYYYPLLRGISEKEIALNLLYFRTIVSSRLRDILFESLQHLQKTGQIKVDKYPIIVVNSGGNVKHIRLCDVDELGLSIPQAEKMLNDACTFALGQVLIYDNKYGITRSARDLSEVSANYKWSDYKKAHDYYVSKTFHWQYVYETITLSLDNSGVSNKVTLKEYKSALQLLQEKVHNAIQTTIKKKNDNKQLKKEKQDNWLESILQNNDEIRENIELGINSKEDIIKTPLFVYPPNFLYCTQQFIDVEIKNNSTID